ncbi:hypothetical protein DEA98_15310 [Brucella pseudogrignonensis]|nr:hypothetical protein [Brucella pseudogrignonensis]
MLAKTGLSPIQLCFRAHFDLILSDRRSHSCFKAHLIRKPFHTFRDALYVVAHYHRRKLHSVFI